MMTASCGTCSRTFTCEYLAALDNNQIHQANLNEVVKQIYEKQIKFNLKADLLFGNSEPSPPSPPAFSYPVRAAIEFENVEYDRSLWGDSETGMA